MTRRDKGIVGALVAIFAVLAIVLAAPVATRTPDGTTFPATTSGASSTAIAQGGAVTPSGSPAVGGSGSPTSPTTGPSGSSGSSSSLSSAAPSGTGRNPDAGSPAPSVDPAPSPSVDPATGIRLGVVGMPTSINPLTARTQADRDLVALVFSGLVKLGPKDVILPDLADRWTTDKTGRHWTFHLRDSATWHDGKAVTADDVVFTIRLLRDPKYRGPFVGSWNEITVKKVNAMTVRFDLKTPLGDFLQLARQPLLPAHLLKSIPVQALTDSAFSTAPVGAGPYRLLQWDSSVALLAKAFEGTDGGSSGAGGLSSDLPYLEFRFFPSAAALASAYRRGEVDVADGLPATFARSLDALPRTRVVRYPRATLSTVLLNVRTNHPTIRDDTVRQALLMAVDRTRLVTDVMGGMGDRADTLVPPTSWAYVKTAARAMPYDTTRAAKALKSDGWRKVNGKWHPPGSKSIFLVEILTTTKAANPIVWEAAQFVARSWRSFGISVRVVALAPADLIERLSGADFTAAVVDMNIGLDPDLYPLLASRQAGIGGSNLSGVQSLVLDELLVAARKPGSLAERRGAWAKLEQFLSRSQVMLPLAFRDDPMVVSERVVGPRPHLVGDLSDRFWDVLTWRLASAG